jgi:hypothetical protein
VKRNASYINPNISSEDVNRLAKAINDHDTDMMANTIKANTNEAFLGRLFKVDDYNPMIEPLAKEIVNANSHKLREENREYARAGTYKQIVPSLPERQVYAPKIIEQKSRKGTTYKRESPKAFSVAEKGYIQRGIKLGLNNKQLTMNFNKYFKHRSRHSIVTKKRRLKKDVKNR